MKSNQPDTFLTAHARRMRQYQERQRQKDPEGYAERVRTQRKLYRLRQRSKLLSGCPSTQQLKSLINLRKINKERQRRYRLNQTDAQKDLRKEKDRNRKRLARAQNKLNDYNNNSESNKPVTSNL